MARPVVECRVIKPYKMKKGYKGPEILAALRKQEKEIKADFAKIVRTWTGKPTFRSKIRTDRVQVWTDDENFNRLDKGWAGRDIPRTGTTPMHVRSPKGMYRPKSKRGRIYSVAGGQQGTGYWTGRVHQNAVEGRRFYETVQKRHNDLLIKEVRKVMKQQIFWHRS